MFTIRLVKYKPPPKDSAGEYPSEIKAITLRHAEVVHVRFAEDGHRVVQLGDAPGDTVNIIVGDDDDGVHGAYDVAYVTDDSGRTIETVR